MATLRAVTESCMRGFAVVCHAIDQDASLDASSCDDVREEFGRFRVWTGNLGALAKGHSALDWRLRDADVMRSTVLALLEELQSTLELASDLSRDGNSEVFLGADIADDHDLPDDISLPSDDELDSISQPLDGLSHLVQRIQDLVKDLYKLSFRIRNSTSKPARAIHYKEIDASSGLDIFGDCFATLDRHHVSELFRSLRSSDSTLTAQDEVLVRRFAKSNTARRRQFRYWQKHAQKLTTTEISELVVTNDIPLEPQQQPVRAHPTLKPVTNTQASQSHHGKTIFTTTEATFFDPKLDLTSLETQSVISSATTTRDLEGKPADLPPPPLAALNGQDFVCPYCFVLCPSTHGQGRAWRKHILQDLQPYSCTQINCASADRLYGSRREWLEHEESQHRRVWVCRFHPSTHFPSQHAFEQHLREQGHGDMTDAQLKDFASIAQTNADDPRQKCPICLEDTASIPQFPAHLAHHLERIATFSIPRGLDDEDSTSLASFRAVPRSMSDRTSVSSELSIFSSRESTDVDPMLDEQTSLIDAIVNCFGEICYAARDTDASSEQPTSDLDSAVAYAFQASPEYMSWCDGSLPRRLVCRTDTHTRKLTFSSDILRDLTSRFPADTPVIRCSLFREHWDDHNLIRTLADLIRQLLLQVRLPVIPDSVMKVYHHLKSSGVTYSVNELVGVIHSIIKSLPRVFLIINDSTEDLRDLEPLLDIISQIQNLCLLVTSSHHLVRSEDEQITVDIDALYSLDHRRRSLSRAMNSRIAEVERNNPGDDQRQSQLIDEAFERIMSHTTKDSGHEDLAMAAYDVVRHAIRPLKDHEFMIAVRHVLRWHHPRPVTYPTITDVIQATGGLLMVQQTSVVSVFHASLSSYFERTHARWFPMGHASMAFACLEILMSEAIPTHTGAGEIGDWAANSFFGYAACTWGLHLRACSPISALEDMAMRYLQNEVRFNLGNTAAFILQPEHMVYGFDVVRGLGPVQVCSIFGLTNLLKRLPHTEFNRRVSVAGQTPLDYACRMGHVDTVEFLLNSAADPVLNSGGQSLVTHEAGFFILYEAIKSKRWPIVETLLRSPVVSLKPLTLGGDGNILLTSLLLLESIDLLRLILARDDVDINAKDHNGRTALWWLLGKSYADSCPEFQYDATQLIVQHPACDINAVDLGGSTYVMRFLHARILDPKLIYLLLEHGADVNRMDEDGETAIFHAVTLRYSLNIASVLVANGADLDIRNKWGQNLIHRIVTDVNDIQDLRYLDLLLDHMPALINSKDNRGRTALHIALVHGKTFGHRSLALELLTRVPDTNCLDDSGRAAFDVACQYGRTGLLWQLPSVGMYKIGFDARRPRRVQSHDALRTVEDSVPQPNDANRNRLGRPKSDVNRRRGHGGNVENQQSGEAILNGFLDDLPGWSLAYMGHFQRLYDRLRGDEIDMLEQSPDDGNTALHWLIRNASKEPALVLEILEAYLNNTPAGCSPQNFEQDTPLHTAILSSQTSMAVVLIKAGADLNLRDTLERTPLDLATELGRDEVVTAIQKSLADTAEEQPQTHETYEKVINESILGTPHEKLAMTALEIASYAMRPLTTTEFEHALRGLIQGQDPGPAPSVSVVDAIIRTDKLLTVLQNYVVFAKDSVSAYFDKTRDRWFPSGQANMAFVCLMVLVFQDLPEDQDTDWASKSFYKYAACEWGRHLRAYSPKLAFVEDLALRYLADVKRLEFGNKIAFLQQAYGFGVYDSDFEYGLGALHVCSLLGLTNSIPRLIADAVPQSVIDSQTHDHKTTPLMYAASMGHLDTVELLLELGADPSLTNLEGRTALYEALRHGSHEVIMLFLSSPTIRPDAIVFENITYTALMIVQCFTSIDAIRALLQRQDIDVNESDEDGNTVLSHVLMDPTPREPGWRVSVTKLILEVPGFHIDAVDYKQRGYIQQLLKCSNFDEDLLQIMLENGIDIEHRDDSGDTAIFFAVLWRPSTKAARILLDHGADIEARNHAGEGLMHHVISRLSELSAISSVKTLLELDPTLVNQQDNRGETALHIALCLGKIALVRIIIQHSPNVDIKDVYGRTALEVARQYGRVYIPDSHDADNPQPIEPYHDHGFLTEAQDLVPLLRPTVPTLQLPLPAWSLAYIGRYIQLHRRMMDNCLVMLEASPGYGFTALHHLMRLDPRAVDVKKQILQNYLRASNECSPKNIMEQTPLHIAIHENNVELAELLIRHGADLGAREHSRKTPLELAKTLERTEIIAAIGSVLAKRARNQPEIVIEPVDHDIQSHVSASPVSLQDLDLYTNESDADEKFLKNEIVSWLQGFTELKPPNVSSNLLDTEEYQRLLGSTNFTAWCTGSSPRRIICCGFHHTRLTSFISAIYHNLVQNLPGVPILSCFVSRKTLNISRHEEAGNILANLLGQLVAYGSAETVPAELVQLYRSRKVPRTRPSNLALVRLLRDLMLSYPKIFLVMDAHSWNDEMIQVWRSITDLCSENLSILVATTDYQQPTPGNHCDHCGNLTAKYWYCAVCDGEGFYICSVCKSRGLACLDASHDLAHFDASRDQVIVDVVSRRLI